MFIKDEIVQNFQQQEVPKHLAKLQKLQEMYGKDGFFVGDKVAHKFCFELEDYFLLRIIFFKLSMADLYVYEILSNTIELIPNLLDNYESLTLNRLKVESSPLVSAYLAKRKPNLPVDHVRSFFLSLHQ